MEFRNTKVNAELLPEGVTQLYQGHVVKSDAIATTGGGGRTPAANFKICAGNDRRGHPS